jgi:hypothetical protein
MLHATTSSYNMFGIVGVPARHPLDNNEDSLASWGLVQGGKRFTSLLPTRRGHALEPSFAGSVAMVLSQIHRVTSRLCYRLSA